jgi:hypothetical protein
MSKKKLWTGKQIYDFASVALNIYLTGATILFAIHVFAPLLGGKLLFNALIVYGSWIGMALCSKYFLSRLRKGLPIRLHEYVLLSLYSIGCMFLWFPYPISILFSILTIVGIVFSYKAQHRRARAARS